MSSINLINKFTDEHSGLMASYFLINIFTLGLETIVLSQLSSKIYTNIGDKSKLYSLFMTFLFVLFLIKAGYAIRSYLYDIIIPRFNTYIKEHIYNNIIERYQIDYKELNTGYILYNFQHIPGAFSRLMIEFLQEYIPNTLAILICVVFLMYIKKDIGFIALSSIALFIIVMLLCIPKSMTLSYNEHTLSENSNQHIQDKISNLFNIYVSGTEEFEKQKYHELERTLEKATYDNYTFNTILSSFLQLLSVIIFASAFYVIYKKYDIKESSSYVLLIIVISYFSGYLTRISSNLIGVVEIFGYIDKSDAFFNEIEPVKQNVEIFIEPNLNGPIEFKNANFSYPESDQQILQNLNLYIRPKSKIAILGQSGSGKTTLIKLLLGFYSLNEGNIYLNGIDIKNVDIQMLRKNIGVLTQNVKLFDKSVIENIIYGTSATKEDAKKLISNFNIRIFDNLQNGLNGSVGTDGSNLSGGQKQVVNFLRAILKNTPVLLLDEPTSALDANTKNVILGIIDKLNDKTVIIITHDKDVLSHVEYSYQLKNNKLVLVT